MRRQRKRADVPIHVHVKVTCCKGGVCIPACTLYALHTRYTARGSACLRYDNACHGIVLLRPRNLGRPPDDVDRPVWYIDSGFIEVASVDRHQRAPRRRGSAFERACMSVGTIGAARRPPVGRSVSPCTTRSHLRWHGQARAIELDGIFAT